MENKQWVPGGVRLEWVVDESGYDLRRPQRDRQRERSKLFPFWENRAVSYLDDGEEGSVIDDHHIVPLGGALKTYDIGIGEKDVYLDLLKETPEGFTSKWGLLTTGRYGSLLEFAKTRQNFEDLLEGKTRKAFKALAQINEGATLGTAQVRISKIRRDGEPEIVWYVRDLRLFCLLEYLAAIGGAVEICRCPQCGNFFRRRHLKGPASKYCRGACKQRAYNERLRKRSGRDVTNR